MEKTLVIVLAGILIAGFLLYVRGKIREARCSESFRRDLKVGQYNHERSICRWFIDADGEWGRVRTKLPRDSNQG